jgi:Ca2+:H+ antiporter
MKVLGITLEDKKTLICDDKTILLQETDLHTYDVPLSIKITLKNSKPELKKGNKYYLFIFKFQTDTHVHFFKFKKRSRVKRYQKEEDDENYFFDKKSSLFNVIFLIFLLVLIGFLSEIFANEGVKVFKQMGLTAGFVGILIAFVTAAPELFTAIRAAKNDEMQRVVNIAMGASTVSILLTVPILIFLSLIFGIKFTLDFTPLQVGALMITILLVWKTTENGETNYLEGLSHLMLFLSYAIMAIFY